MKLLAVNKFGYYPCVWVFQTKILEYEAEFLVSGHDLVDFSEALQLELLYSLGLGD